jgi:hypothetical protein
MSRDKDGCIELLQYMEMVDLPTPRPFATSACFIPFCFSTSLILFIAPLFGVKYSQNVQFY